jgi:hypothetical protein
MALKDPAADLCALLDGQTLGGVLLSAGSNLFSAGRTEGTKPAVYLLNVGGEAPIGFLNNRGEALYQPQVQVLVEGVEDDFSRAEALARAVFSALHLAAASGYVGVFCRDAQPMYLGENLWVINVDAPWAP